MRTVIEYCEFTRKAHKEFEQNEIEKIVSFLSENPKAGSQIEHFGGLRKLPWNQKGKKETNWNIYFHPGANNLPLVIISMFKKNEKCILDKLIEILIHNKISDLK